MIKGVLKLGTLATFLMALSTAPSPTPAFAAGGGGGGGGGGGDPSSAYLAPSPPPPSVYPKRSGTKATHKLKKTKQSSLDDSTFGQAYRAAYATIYDRNDYAAAIEQLKALGRAVKRACISRAECDSYTVLFGRRSWQASIRCRLK